MRKILAALALVAALALTAAATTQGAGTDSYHDSMGSVANTYYDL
jgi:predicted small secreted protein